MMRSEFAVKRYALSCVEELISTQSSDTAFLFATHPLVQVLLIEVPSSPCNELHALR